jgi:DNA-binding NarL/FixJ family response regulator
MKRPRVLLADDHRLLREAFAQLLEPGCDVVGAVADGRALLEAAPQLRQLRRSMPEVKLIFLTVSEDPDLAAEAFQAGASGYVLKNSAASELFQAIQEVAQGRSYVTPLATRGLVANFLHQPESAKKTTELSPRQREVLQLLAEGHAMKEIARILKITPRTVALHKYSIMETLGVKSNAQLVQFAIKQHVVSV